jgi:hypothetical protein
MARSAAPPPPLLLPLLGFSLLLCLMLSLVSHKATGEGVLPKGKGSANARGTPHSPSVRMTSLSLRQMES